MDGLDLDVPAGEIVGLLGANGAGKTTTVECIQGLRKPDGGRLRVLGFDPVTQPERLRPLVGSQLQSSALPDRLRVAEALCGRVVVMRAGHVIDAGAPADLVERHASTAVIRFSMPDPPAQLLDQVRRLDGVREVERSGARITVRGHRRIVAHVCAALVRWEPVPADLAISQPGLEDALLGLLNGEHEEQPAATSANGELIGGRR